MRLFIEQIWSASREGKPLSRGALFFWFFLKILSYFYAFGLRVRAWLLKYKKIPHSPQRIPVIAVGNLSVGGTGKSVFVAWLINHSGFDRPAVLLRGYKSPILRLRTTWVVSTREKIFGAASVIGDEPLQVAEQGVAVAIGKNRYDAACDLVSVLKKDLPDVFILDDGYQTQTIKKNCSILLIDARAPIENGFLFPASPLRELDYRRASIIVLTHADQANEHVELIKKKYFPDVNPQHIFTGKHRFDGFLDASGKPASLAKSQSVVLCSGIAKPYNLEHTVKRLDLDVRAHVIFADHHMYAPKDIEVILAQLSQAKCSILLTTQKDWTKLREFETLFVSRGIVCLIAKIAFEFLTTHEYDVFVALLRKQLIEGRVTL